MKKLLALVLCVMMFVSVLPTAAFAGSYLPNVDSNTVASYNKQIKNMIKNTKEDIEKAYKALAGDKIVYTSAKAMDDTIVEMVNGIANPLIEKGKFTKDEADFVKNGIRWYLDEVVAEKIEKNMYKALDKDGNVDDLKYANVVAESISKALTDKKFIAGYEAVATFFALKSVIKDINDNLSDEWDAFADGIDTKFQSRFAAQYTTLVSDYIDTLDTAALKLYVAANADDIYADALAEAQAEYDAVVDPAALALATATADATAKYDDKIAAADAAQAAARTAAEAERDAVVDPAIEALTDALDAADAAYDAIHEPAVINRTYEYEVADAQYDVDKTNADSTHETNVQNIEATYEAEMAYAETLPDDQRAEYEANAKHTHDMNLFTENQSYEARLTQIQGFKDGKYAIADANYDAAMGTAEEDYEAAYAAAYDDFDEATAAAIAEFNAKVAEADNVHSVAVEGAFLEKEEATADAQAVYDAIEEAAKDAQTLADQEAFIDWVENSNPDINPWAIYLEVGNPDWT